jgi:Rieske 2Fe-2S family protein
LHWATGLRDAPLRQLGREFIGESEIRNIFCLNLTVQRSQRNAYTTQIRQLRPASVRAIRVWPWGLIQRLVPHKHSVNNRRMTLLTETKTTLPSKWYFDPSHYARELEAIWYRDWICVGRLEDLPGTGDYFIATIGNQRLIVTRGADNRVRAFHNTCRHRGSALCTSDKGHFRNGRIICPYHTWTYSLEGELLATPARIQTDDFRAQDYSLYQVHTDTWRGFLFVNLGKEPGESLVDFLGTEAAMLDNWPLAEMVSVHQDRSRLACNWKVFWENYSECYHCPRLHPELCKIVPVYRKGIVDPADDPAWKPEFDGDRGLARVSPDLETWTLDGHSQLPRLEGLTDTELAMGMTFASFTASMFVVGHRDYVRSVRLLPTGPESVELFVDWYLMPGIQETHADKLESLFEFGRLVVRQDGEACELNQQGLRSRPHLHGVLVPQEAYLWSFHEWLRERLGNVTGP